MECDVGVDVCDHQIGSERIRERDSSLDSIVLAADSVENYVNDISTAPACRRRDDAKLPESEAEPMSDVFSAGRLALMFRLSKAAASDSITVLWL